MDKSTSSVKDFRDFGIRPAEFASEEDYDNWLKGNLPADKTPFLPSNDNRPSSFDSDEQYQSWLAGKLKEKSGG